MLRKIRRCKLRCFDGAGRRELPRNVHVTGEVVYQSSDFRPAQALPDHFFAACKCIKAAISGQPKLTRPRLELRDSVSKQRFPASPSAKKNLWKRGRVYQSSDFRPAQAKTRHGWHSCPVYQSSDFRPAQAGDDYHCFGFECIKAAISGQPKPVPTDRDIIPKCIKAAISGQPKRGGTGLPNERNEFRVVCETHCARKVTEALDLSGQGPEHDADLAVIRLMHERF